MLRQFTIPPRLDRATLWGGGWVVGTGPWEAGWQVRRLMVDGRPVWVLSNPGDTVCATIKPLGSGWDVGIWWDSADVVRSYLLDGVQFNADGATIDAEYHQYSYSGFGIEVIRLLDEASAAIVSQSCDI